MERSEILEILNGKYNSNLYDLILDRLEFFSYEVQDKDLSMIAQCLQTVINEAMIQCNVDEIPELYNYHIVDAVIGEFFGMKKAFNQLDISSLNLTGAIASVSMGNTSVSYDNSNSDSAKLDTYIELCKGRLARLYACLRRLKF
jgi:hypothetical protein